MTEFSHTFFSTAVDGIEQAYTEMEQMRDGKARVAAAGRTDSMGMAAGGSAGSLGSEGIGTRLMDTVKSVSDQVTGRGSESGIKQ